MEEKKGTQIGRSMFRSLFVKNADILRCCCLIFCDGCGMWFWLCLQVEKEMKAVVTFMKPSDNGSSSVHGVVTLTQDVSKKWCRARCYFRSFYLSLHRLICICEKTASTWPDSRRWCQAERHCWWINTGQARHSHSRIRRRSRSMSSWQDRSTLQSLQGSEWHCHPRLGRQDIFMILLRMHFSSITVHPARGTATPAIWATSTSSRTARPRSSWPTRCCHWSVAVQLSADRLSSIKSQMTLASTAIAQIDRFCVASSADWNNQVSTF